MHGNDVVPRTAAVRYHVNRTEGVPAMGNRSSSPVPVLLLGRHDAGKTQLLYLMKQGHIVV